ncbi:MAG: MBL fold metallo-hydrolase [bacterium]
MRIKYEQKFHPIGQGLFYSSSLYLNDNIAANVIFDCGSENIDLIKKGIKEFNSSNIDVLIISHLHFDHISGLDFLLNNRRVNTVVLPYLIPEERILVQSLNYNKPEWYNEFLSNPYSYLNEKENVENVIIINSSDEENDYAENFPEEIPPLNDNLINENRNIQIQLENVDEEIKKTIGTKENLKFSKNLSLMKDKGYILISNMYLSFFNYKIENNKKVKDFYSEIKRLKITDTKSAISQLLNDKKREQFKKSYEIIRKDINITSLAAYQGFTVPFHNRKHSIYIRGINSVQYDFLNNIFCCNCDGFIDGHFHGRSIKGCKYKFYFDFFCDCHKHCNCSNMVGTLLLGDIKLDYKTKKRKKMFIHFKKLLPYVKLVQLSHHGAENGWNENLIKEIPKNSLFIASHRTINKYHHPHKKVIMELVENNRKFISVTEKNEYYNEIEFDN